MSTPPETRRSMKDLLLVPAGKFFFKYRNFLFPVVFAPVALLVPPRVDPAHPAQDWITDAIGLAIVLGGQGLRALVIGLAYIHRGGKNKQVYASTLVKEGLFAHSRNPLYLGNLMIVFGLVVIHHHPLVYAVVLPFFLYAYFAIVAAEEAYLLDRFGAEYAEYCRTVPRFLLRLTAALLILSGSVLAGEIADPNVVWLYLGNCSVSTRYPRSFSDCTRRPA